MEHLKFIHVFVSVTHYTFIWNLLLFILSSISSVDVCVCWWWVVPVRESPPLFSLSSFVSGLYEGMWLSNEGIPFSRSLSHTHSQCTTLISLSHIYLLFHPYSLSPQPSFFFPNSEGKHTSLSTRFMTHTSESDIFRLKMYRSPTVCYFSPSNVRPGRVSHPACLPCSLITFCPSFTLFHLEEQVKPWQIDCKYLQFEGFAADGEHWILFSCHLNSACCIY